MLDQHYSDVIDTKDFKALLASYPVVVPEKLAEVEEERHSTIPKALRERTPAHLTKTEVQRLVDWKLSHGTFRPSLKKLVASNTEAAVKESTRVAFALYAEKDEAWEQAVVKLAKDLRGVGPATASLLLSVYDSERVPFFSDELFRWVMFEDGKGKGWDRKMKYSIGEYKQMVPLVQRLRERLEKEGSGAKFTALEVEMVAYVLGRRIDTEAAEGGKKRAASDSEDELKEASVGEAKQDGKKRQRRTVPS